MVDDGAEEEDEASMPCHRKNDDLEDLDEDAIIQLDATVLGENILRRLQVLVEVVQ